MNDNNNSLLPVNDSYKRENNEYQSYTQTFVEGFVSKLFDDGIVNEIKTEDLVKWFANPDKYHADLEKINQYFYISNGDVFQQFDLTRVLPTLNYKVENFNKSKNYEKNILLINKILNKIKYRTLTRDLITQEITTGTVIGMWIGDKKNPYFYTFDNLEYIFPAYRKNGDWVVVLDLQWVRDMKESERITIFNNLYPYVTQSHLDDYLTKGNSAKYIELPQDRTCVLRTHTNKRNQRLGIPWASQGLMDINHKKKLKDMEVAIANKIIKSIVTLKLGNDRVPDPPTQHKRKVVAGVKTALNANEKVNGIPVIATPDWVDIKFNEQKSDALDPKKFTTINSDINSSLGTGSTMKDGTGGNFASGKINLEVFYRKIAVLLEEIEEEVFPKLLAIILPASIYDEYKIVFDKEPPLSLKDKLDALFKLQNQGFSTKSIIDCISDIQWDDYLEQSKYEIETLKLRDKIKPPQTSSTLSKADAKNGRPVEPDGGSEGNQASKTNDGNNLPDA